MISLSALPAQVRGATKAELKSTVETAVRDSEPASKRPLQHTSPARSASMSKRLCPPSNNSST